VGRFDDIFVGLEVLGCGEGSSDFVRDGLVVGIADGKSERLGFGFVGNVSLGLTLDIVGDKDGDQDPRPVGSEEEEEGEREEEMNGKSCVTRNRIIPNDIMIPPLNIRSLNFCPRRNF